MAKKIPKFTYTGECATSADNTYWYIKLKSSGQLTFSYKKTVDVFLVGGGGSAGTNWSCGGAGGYTTTKNGIALSAGQQVTCTVGAGQAGMENWVSSIGTGGQSSFGSYASANGGQNGTSDGKGGNGGCGGGGYTDNDAGNGGSDGGDGAGGSDGRIGGTGQHTSTREFGVAGATLYAGGGGGNGYGGEGGGGNHWAKGGNVHSNIDGKANTGGGGGSGNGVNTGNTGGNGGSGIIIIRGTQDDLIPVFFNGTQLSQIIYNGVTLTSLIYNGTKIYCRKAKRALERLLGRRKEYEVCHFG